MSSIIRTSRHSSWLPQVSLKHAAISRDIGFVNFAEMSLRQLARRDRWTGIPTQRPGDTHEYSLVKHARRPRPHCPKGIVIGQMLYPNVLDETEVFSALIASIDSGGSMITGPDSVIMLNDPVNCFPCSARDNLVKKQENTCLLKAFRQQPASIRHELCLCRGIRPCLLVIIHDRETTRLARTLQERIHPYVRKTANR